MSEEKSTALATPDAIASLIAAEGPSPYAEKEGALSAVTKVGDYLPYVQVYSGSSKEVKKKEIEMGVFGIRESKNSLINIGEEFIAFVIAWRPKAMQFQPKVLSFFDVESKEFKEIEAKAEEKNSGCGFGPEFLLWLPEYKRFATYFLGNKTGRNEAPNLIGPLKDKGPFACIQKAKLIETPDYTWHGPTTLPYDNEFEMPVLADLQEQLHKFNNPPVSQEEVAEKSGDDESGRD